MWISATSKDLGNQLDLQDWEKVHRTLRLLPQDGGTEAELVSIVLAPRYTALGKMGEWFLALDMALWSREKAQNLKILQEEGKEVELAPDAPVYQVIAVGKRNGWLSAPDTSLWDRGKIHIPKTNSPGRSERSGMSTSIEKVWEFPRISSQGAWWRSLPPKVSS